MPGEYFSHFSSLRMLIGALLLFTSVMQVALSEGQEPTISSPGRAQFISDLVVAPGDDDAPTIFMVDGIAIYSRRLSNEDAMSFDLRDFNLFFRSPEFRAPSALAYRNGRLLVCDQKAGAIFELDIKKRNIKAVITALKAPNSVAISDRGIIAVGDASFRRVFWYDPEKEPRVLGYDYSEPGRLVFAGTELLALNKNTGVITSLVTPLTQAEQTAQSQNTGDRFRREAFKEAVDFTFYRGIYYVVSKLHVVALSRASGAISQPLSVESPSLIAANDRFLFIVDDDRKSIRKWPRQTPVKVSFEFDLKLSAEQQRSIHQEALSALYLYLHSQKMLPTQKAQWRPRDSNNSLQQLLFAENALLPPWGSNPSSAGLLTAQTIRNLEKLFCYLNTSCKREDPANPMPLIGQPGDSILLPKIPFKSELISSALSLSGKSIQEHLTARVSPEHLAKLNPNSLWKSNTPLRKTTEGILSSQGFIIPDSMRGPLQPGTILTFQNGREVIRGDLNKCNPDLQTKVRARPASIPTTTLSHAPEAVLPWQTIQPSLRQNEVRKLGIADVEVSLNKPVVRQLDQAAIEVALRHDPSTRQCLQQTLGPETYLVIEVLNADQANYRFRRRDGSLKTLAKEELQRTNLLGEADLTGEWSWVTAGPVNSGYRLLNLNGSLDPERWKIVDDPATVKPDATQNFLSLTHGEIELPATRLSLSVFVNADDLTQRNTALRQAVSRTGVYIFSEEERRASKAVSDEAAPAATSCAPDMTFNQIREARENLKRKINYRPPEPGISEARIGIGEDAASVNRFHPDFSDESGSTWYKEEGERDLSPEPIVESLSRHGSPLIKQFSEERDHGSHVAGLLAGRAGERSVPGLLPTAGLFLINHRIPAGLDTPAGLDKAIENAIARSIYIFNFSFTINRDATMTSLKEKMRGTWKNKLFVVAAGNNYKDVRSMEERVAISWAGDLPNIIGVGATDDNLNLLAPYAPDPGQPHQKISGSNWSKQHVHLLAPGKDILSTASENKYACASGTSMAVPQVTAAAVALSDQGFSDPLWIKARLIYTADWAPQLADKVWGGQLNYGRAVWRPNLNLLALQNTPGHYAMFENEGNALIEVSDGEIDDPHGYQIDRPRRIRFKDILRIQRLDPPYEGLFRVIYLEGANNRQLRILNNATISGKVRCRALRKWKESENAFDRVGQCPTAELEVSAFFYDYVARIPAGYSNISVIF